ncbi:MAG TPA: PQQ-binding-like beta-propeller repeat protein [Kofleriaceae bacterium]|nr:PQQ-binding-like beta-propeller repeat protein [Kofleriaceae bacterium]
MRAIQVKCPNCAAVLRVDGDAEVVDCEYCHTQSWVQRRTRMLQIPVGLPPARAAGAASAGRAARQVVRRVALGVSLFSTLVPLAVVGVVGFTVKNHLHRAADAMAGLVGKPPTAGRRAGAARADGGTWVGVAPPLLTDVNGDGIADLVGRVRYVSDGDRAHITAVSGDTGKPLWESARIGTYSDTLQGRLAVVGDAVLFAGATGSVTAVGLADGKPRFAASLPDRPARLCRKDAASVAIETADGRWQEISLIDGAVRRARKPSSCDRVPDDERNEIDPAVSASRSARRWSQPGMHVARELRRGPGGPAVGIGWRRPGTAVPMVAGLDPKGRVTWKAEVPDGDPLAARAGSGGLWTATERLVCATYERTGGSTEGVHLTCFELERGARAWDVAIPGERSTVLTSLVAAGDRVYLSGWGLLLGLDARTGRWLPGLGP